MLSHKALVPVRTPAESLLPAPYVDPQRDSADLQVATEIDNAAVLQRPRAITRPIVNRMSVPDYTWLMDRLRMSLERVKVYPASAKASGAQGRVVVQVSIHRDGRMTNSQIEETSGYAILDQAALEAVRATSPLKLDHVLEGSPIVMLVPLNYQLE
jgi:protein TonB